MLAKDPALRPTLAQVRAVVATVAATLPPRTGGRASTLRVSHARSRWIVATVATVALALTGIAIGTRLTSGPAGTPAPPAPPARESEQAASLADAPRVPVDAPAATPPPPPDEIPETPRRKTPARSTSAAKTRDRPPATRDDGSGPPTTADSVDTVDPPIPPQKPPVDRDQTINPFKHKVNP